MLPDLNLQPTLVGATVVVRPLAADDWNAFYEVARDPLIWAQHPFATRWQEPVARAYFDDGLASGGALAIERRADRVLLGSSRYRLADDGASVEIGSTFLARAHWGGTTNREVKRLMLAHAFTAVETVTFCIGTTNVRSRRAIERIGAHLTDRVEHTEIAGLPVEHVVYAIEREGAARRR